MKTTRAPRRAGMTAHATGSAGAILRHWRNARHMSQLTLALEAGISPRHLCFLETGRSKPSREMVQLLAEVMDVPLRERNTLLLAAGFAPTFRESSIDLGTDDLAPVRAALEAMLSHHEPFPAVVMNRYWDVLMRNDGAKRFFGFLRDGPVKDDAVNVLRMMFNPEGARPAVANWEATAEALIKRVHREAVGGILDQEMQQLLDEVLSYPGVPREWRAPDLHAPQLPVIPVTFAKAGKQFSFFSAVTTLGTPQDVLLQEIRIESFFPLDAATRRNVNELTETADSP